MEPYSVLHGHDFLGTLWNFLRVACCPIFGNSGLGEFEACQRKFLRLRKKLCCGCQNFTNLLKGRQMFEAWQREFLRLRKNFCCGCQNFTNPLKGRQIFEAWLREFLRLRKIFAVVPGISSNGLRVGKFYLFIFLFWGNKGSPRIGPQPTPGENFWGKFYAKGEIFWGKF